MPSATGAVLASAPTSSKRPHTPRSPSSTASNDNNPCRHGLLLPACETEEHHMTTPFLWHNGQIKPWTAATVPVSTHALHYGSSVFEGERVYATPQGPAYFRLAD